MKKLIILLFALVLLSTPARAQLMLGGHVGFNRDTKENSTEISIRPDVSYEIGKWAFGVFLELQFYRYKGTVANNMIGISPYVQYTLFKNDFIYVFMEGGVPYSLRTFSDQKTPTQVQWSPYIGPGLGINLTDHWSLSGTFGKLEYNTYNRTFNLSMDATAVSLGMFYAF